MAFRLIAVGKLKSAEAELFSRYAKRLGKALSVTELPDSQASKVGTKIGAGPLIALDERGKNLSTQQLHDWLEARGYDSSFVIGGADGLPADVRDRADLTLAFGAMTWPHQLARALLVEQLYRVETLRTGHPYHRA